MSEPDNRKNEPLIREFPVDLASADGRNVEARIVPYNTVARVADPPDFEPYDEMFMPGAFERQLNAANRVQVLLNFEHEQGIRGVVGHGTSLEERDDGLYGVFRIHENADGDKALQLVNEGLLTGLSVEAYPTRTHRVDSVVQRVKAHLDKVALTRTGRAAYKDAQVLAVRTTPAVELAPMSDEMRERLAAVGVEPLRRVKSTRKQWDPDTDRFSDEEYELSCLIDRGGDLDVKDRCMLPVREPDGTVNENALGIAASAIDPLKRLKHVKFSQRTDAARKLLRYYRRAGATPPDTLVHLAHTETR